jgi:hypothetical protein
LTSDPLPDSQNHSKAHPNRLKETGKLQVLTDLHYPTDGRYLQRHASRPD